MRIFVFGKKRCRYAEKCRLYQPGHHTCEDDKEASSGNFSGSPYCGAFRRFRELEINGNDGGLTT